MHIQTLLLFVVMVVVYPCFNKCNKWSFGGWGFVQASTPIYLAGIFDIETYSWGEEVFNYTISMLNNRTDGFHDDIFAHDDDTIIEFDVVNDACDETTAARAYWALRQNRSMALMTSDDNADDDNEAQKQIIHGIVGSRCSGASIAIARIAGLESIPQISPISNSVRLSNKDEFPFFSRVVAPGNVDGEVGALMALLREMKWKRVGVINTDTQFAKDIAAEFRKVWPGPHNNTVSTTDNNEPWEGEIAYTNTISLTSGSSGDVDEESVLQVLRSVPTNDPTVNSRIIVLVAHEEHAFPILKIATEMGFQPDTIWVGITWIGRDSLIDTKGWLPEYPGYLGIAPYRNMDKVAADYFNQVRNIQQKRQIIEWITWPNFAVQYLVDSIVAMTAALSNVSSVSQRNNGTLVTQQLRQLNFSGVSGPVSFTMNGDRASPRYTIFNYQKIGPLYDWVAVGDIGANAIAASFSTPLCFAMLGCDVSEVPSDTYPIPRIRAPVWVRFVIPIIAILLFGLVVQYWRSHRSHKATLQTLQGKLATLDDAVDEAIAKRNRLILAHGALMDKPDTWTDSNRILVEVGPMDDEYWTVAERLQETMDDAHISSLWRIQNVALWSYFTFHKQRLAINGIDANETAVWHGTSGVDPSVIYNDQQDGFMMQHSRDGFWGRGIYFAEKGSYSHGYSYKPALRPASSVVDGRSVGKEGEREMFLAKLLIGKHVFLDRDESSTKAAECRALTVPPIDPRTNLKYNTVTGNTGGSQVWIVYENGRAYPEYLVRYYRGKRDPMRTPFPCKMDVSKDSITTSISDDDIEGGTGGSINGVTWEYSDSGAWIPYAKKHQIILEAGYQQFFLSNRSVCRSVAISTDAWTYEVDFIQMKQTNVKHPAHTKRGVRRHSVEDETVA